VDTNSIPQFKAPLALQGPSADAAAALTSDDKIEVSGDSGSSKGGTRYSPATVGLAATLSAVLASALVLLIAFLIDRLRGSDDDTEDLASEADKPSRFFGTVSSRGFGSIASIYSTPNDEIETPKAVTAQ